MIECPNCETSVSDSERCAVIGGEGEWYECPSCEKTASADEWESEDDSETVVYEYDELILGYDGIRVTCRDCTERVFVKHIAEFGCHQCGAEPRNVEIKAREESK